MFSLLVAVVLLAVLLVRVGYIKVVHGEEYQQKAEEQQVSSIDVKIPALRGSIYDCNGNVLAESSRVYNIILDCKVLIESTQVEQESTLEQLCAVLGLDDDSAIRQYLDPKYTDYRYMRLEEGSGISGAMMQEIQDAIDLGKVVGVWFEEDEDRNYVNDSLAAHVIGFNGTYGVEQYYNDELEGVAGRKMVVSGNGNSYTEEYIAAQNGNNLTLTLNSKVQYNIEEILADSVQKTNALRGAAILMDCNTGGIVAMAEVPTYNLNNVNEISGMSKKYQEAHPDTSADDYYTSVWNSWVLSSTYEPGSTFKPIFAAAALNEDVISENDTFYCAGDYIIGDAYVSCDGDEIHGTGTVHEILYNSCTCGMAQISELLGVNKWLEYQDTFGLATLTGIDIAGEAGNSDMLVFIDPDKAEAMGTTNGMGVFELATTAFGQGFRVTPIQELCAFNSVINGGEYLQPYVVSQVTDENGNVISSTSKTVLRNTVSEDVSEKIRSYLLDTVNMGTGTMARTPGYEIAGKTGTAEKLSDTGEYMPGKYIVSFLSFVPYDDPQYIMLVILDETDSSSSNQVALISGKIWEKVLPSLGIYPDPSVNQDAVSPSSIEISTYNVPVSDTTDGTTVDETTEDGGGE